MLVNAIQNTTTYKPVQFKANIKVDSDAQCRVFNQLIPVCNAFEEDQTQYYIHKSDNDNYYCISRPYPCASRSSMRVVRYNTQRAGYIRDAILNDLVMHNPNYANIACKKLIDIVYAEKLEQLKGKTEQREELIDRLEKQKELDNKKLETMKGNEIDFIRNLLGTLPKCEK